MSSTRYTPRASESNSGFLRPFCPTQIVHGPSSFSWSLKVICFSRSEGAGKFERPGYVVTGQGDGIRGHGRHTSAMGVRTRGLDIAIGAKRQVADAAARAEAKAGIERWNEQLVARHAVVSDDPAAQRRKVALVPAHPAHDPEPRHRRYPGGRESRAADSYRRDGGHM
jgi:hypothetical protein